MTAPDPAEAAVVWTSVPGDIVIVHGAVETPMVIADTYFEYKRVPCCRTSARLGYEGSLAGHVV